MLFTVSALAAVLALCTRAATSPLKPRQETLQYWHVTAVSSHTPSGRPGSYPWAVLTANITDPNTIDLGPAHSDGSNVTVPAGSQGINCIATSFTKARESPLGRTWPCDPVDAGYWMMQVLAGSDGTYSPTNFGLKFTHVADVLYQGSEYTASFEGAGHFELGKQLAGTCGGSGVCNWGLREGQGGVLVGVEKV